MSFKRIGQDNYVKDDITFQDTVNEDKEKVLDLLKDYIRIPHEYCEHLVLGSKIKWVYQKIKLLAYQDLVMQKKFLENYQLQWYQLLQISI